ncbi:MAG: O-antigen ligase family protein [Burkholderiaceae bacterium]
MLVVAGMLWTHASRSSRIALAIAWLVFAGVALQLLSWPGGEGALGARQLLHEAQSSAGIDGSGLRISLTPWATERGVWALLPAIAAFSAALLLPIARRASLSWLVVAIACASLVLGFLQLGAPQDSPLNPFPQHAPALGGVFANPNHQATALTIALVLVLSWLLGTLGTRGDGSDEDDRAFHSLPLIWRRVAAAVLAAFLLVAVPLTGSRGMVLIAAGALLLVPLTSGWLRQQMRSRRGATLGLVLLGGGALLAVGLLVAVSGWVRVDTELESRGALAKATAGMAREAMPLGTGVGSFVPWFDAHAPESLIEHEYFNHAHNEYVQWWLESGVGGLLWIALLATVMLWAFPWSALPARRRKDGEPVRSRPEDGDWLASAAWLAVAVVLAHSLVDYPLRTTALMTVTAWFAGITVAAASRRGRAA